MLSELAACWWLEVLGCVQVNLELPTFLEVTRYWEIVGGSTAPLLHCLHNESEQL